MIKKNNFQSNSNLPTLYFDGGSRGNPGKAAGAGVILMPDGEKHCVSQYLNFATNNEAEYTGLIVGLEKAQQLGIKNLNIQGDSNLVVNQIQGKWKVKSPNLQSYYEQAKKLINQLSSYQINWIPREANQLADSEANKCMDTKQSQRITNDNPKIDAPEISTDIKTKIPALYSQGDIVTISNLLPPENKKQGIITEMPKKLPNGKWLITLEIE
jgi:ribonuclease HI